MAADGTQRSPVEMAEQILEALNDMGYLRWVTPAGVAAWWGWVGWEGGGIRLLRCTRRLAGSEAHVHGNGWLGASLRCDSP